MGVIAMALLLSSSYVVVSEFEDETEDVEAFGGLPGKNYLQNLVFCTGLALNSLGAVMMEWAGGDSILPPGGDVESVHAAMRDLQGELVQSNYKTGGNVFTSLVQNDSQLWGFIQAYYGLMADTVAATLWTKDGTYDPDKIVERSGLLVNLANYYYNVANTWNNLSLSWADRNDLWNDHSAYRRMQMGFSYGSTDWMADEGAVTARLMNRVIPTDGHNRVFIYVYDTTQDIVNIGGSSALVAGCNDIFVPEETEMVSEDTGMTYGIPAGLTDLTSLGVRSGWYTLSSGHTYVSGNIVGSSSIDGAMPGAALLLDVAGAHGVAVYDNGNVVVARAGVEDVASDISMKVKVDGDEHQWLTYDMTNLLNAYTTLIKATDQCILDTVKDGETAWRVYDRLETSETVLKPSSITAGTQTDDPLTADQASVMYLAAMQQMASLADGAGPDDVMISPDSLHFYVYGDIYYRDTLVEKGAIFTPFSYADATLSAGMNEWKTIGTAMVWANGLPSYSAWDGVTTGAAIISLSDDMRVDAKNIIKDGNEVSSVSMTVNSIRLLGYLDFSPPKPHPSPHVVDIVPFIRVICVLLGAMIAVIGLVIRVPWIVLIGAIIAVAGWFASSFVAGLMFWGGR